MVFAMLAGCSDGGDAGAGSAIGVPAQQPSATPGQVVDTNPQQTPSQQGPDSFTTQGGPDGDSAPSQTPTVGTAGVGAPQEMESTPGEGVPMEAEPVEPPPVGSAEWGQMGYDLASSYFNRAETVLTKENAATLKEVWKADMGAPVYGAPLQIGDTIYASSTAGVRSFDAATGNENWKVGSGTTASMAYSDGTLYLHRRVGVVALNAADGSQLWATMPDSSSGQETDGSSSPLVAGDVVLIGGASGSKELFGGGFRGYLAGLDRMTGDVTWITHTVMDGANGASIWSSPSADLAAGRAYGSTGNNYGAPASDTSDSIIAFDLQTGDIIWKNQRTENDTFGGGGFSGPDFDFGANPVLYEAMVDGTMTELVSAGAKSGSAHALRRADGTEVWTRSLGEGSREGSRGIFVNSTWSGKNMLFAQNNAGSGATLFALDGATGDIVWERKLAGLVWGRMSVANGVGFVGTGETLQVFDVDTGDVIKEFPSDGGTIAGTISISNGRVAYGEGFTWASGVSGSTLHVLEVE